MRLLDRRRRPCFWVLGDNRCGPSISGEKEMERGTNREDLEVSEASVTERRWVMGKRSVGMEVAHTAQNWRKADRLSGVTGQFLFLFFQHDTGFTLTGGNA